MAAKSSPGILSSHLQDIIDIGFGRWAKEESLLARTACVVLERLSEEDKEKLKCSGSRVFGALQNLITGFWLPENIWYAAADKAISTIYSIHPTPEIVAADIVKKSLSSVFSCIENEEVPTGLGEGVNYVSTVSAARLARFLFIISHIALNQLVYIESCIRKIRKQKSKKERSRHESHASSDGTDDAAEVQGINAELGVGISEDVKIDLLSERAVKEIVSGGSVEKNIIGHCAPFLSKLCRNFNLMQKFPQLQASAMLSLCKLMIIDADFCEANLQLLFTVVENAPSETVRSNCTLALGDLAACFPNLLEPWTENMYARLRDPSVAVTKNAVLVLSHLILNDMMKVKGYINEMAICIEDKDERISSLAKLFFHELSKKGSNPIYNLLPDILGRLSSQNLKEETFCNIMQFLINSIKKVICPTFITSAVKQRELSKMLDEWDEEGDLHPVAETASPTPSILDKVPKHEGLIVFFPGIPGCAKSALCREILSASGCLGDNRPVHSMMGDLIKGKYWQKVANERRKKPQAITLADKNAPNEEVWRQIEDMCRSTNASAVPVIPESEGTDSNPFSLDALAVFIYRVVQRVNHPGNLDKDSPNAGYVLLMFYHLYDGMNRKEFESELYERFGALIKMPLLMIDRKPLPDSVKAILEEGINLFRLHSSKHGRLEPSKGTYRNTWFEWEVRLRLVLSANADYLSSIQVPFDLVVKQVLEQLKEVAKGEHRTPDTEKRRFGNIVFAAVTLPVTDIKLLLRKVASKDQKAKEFLEASLLEDTLQKAHVTLAHKRSHGVTAVASYSVYHEQKVPVDFTALFFTDKMAALEARLGSVNGETIISKNEWPHATLWTAPGVQPKEANALPQLHAEGKATLVEIDPPITVSGVLDFY